MRGTKAITAAAVLAVIVGLTSAASAQVKYSGVGSSAMFNSFEVAAFSDICSARTGSDCRHYSIGGKNAADNQNFAQAVDGRNVSIPVEGGNVWIVWDNNTAPVQIWAYLSVDSVVGNRCFFATPRCQLQVDSGVLTTAGQNKVPASILLNRQTNLTQADEASLPASILSAVQTAFTAAMTDIRPEDAKYATNRALLAYDAKALKGLGYGIASANCPGATSLIGCQIKGTWGAAATPVQFVLSGKKDPLTLQKVPASTTIPVGAAPIIFLYNNTGPGLSGGGFTNITFDVAGNVFNGTKGLASDLPGGVGANPLSVILREPLSGTMNTTEFNTFRVLLAPKFPAVKNSQEKGVDLSTGACPGLGCPNPLDLASADGGVRFRAIGTGQVISGNAGVGGIKNLPDSIGYAFFSYGNVAAIAGGGGVGRYVMLDGVDGIAAAYSAGVLPLCTAPCPAVPGSTFPHLRDGSYRAWSILRLVTDKSGANFTNAQALVTAAQNEINGTVPDFVPVSATPDGDPGMLYLRSHFKISGVTAGTISNAGPENGGDVGGCPFKIGGPNATQTNVRLNGAKASASNVPWPGGACDLTPGHN
jgi:ABC-type phosphate transport system substrate-binding protein